MEMHYWNWQIPFRQGTCSSRLGMPRVLHNCPCPPLRTVITKTRSQRVFSEIYSSMFCLFIYFLVSGILQIEPLCGISRRKDPSTTSTCHYHWHAWSHVRFVAAAQPTTSHYCYVREHLDTSDDMAPCECVCWPIHRYCVWPWSYSIFTLTMELFHIPSYISALGMQSIYRRRGDMSMAPTQWWHGTMRVCVDALRCLSICISVG